MYNIKAVIFIKSAWGRGGPWEVWLGVGSKQYNYFMQELVNFVLEFDFTIQVETYTSLL